MESSEIPSEPQILLILIGLPGSGKTTLSDALVTLSPFPILELAPVSEPEPEPGLSYTSSDLSSLPPRLGRKWVRASQDDAPTRRRQECEAQVSKALREGCSVVVDRVGFDPIQRNHFIRLARTHYPSVQIYALTLHASRPTLTRRLLARLTHPTLTSPALALQVLEQMTRAFDPPRPGRREGFDRVLEMTEGQQPEGGVWTEMGVRRLVRDLKAGYEEVGPDLQWMEDRRGDRNVVGKGGQVGVGRFSHHRAQATGGPSPENIVSDSVDIPPPIVLAPPIDRLSHA